MYMAMPTRSVSPAPAGGLTAPPRRHKLLVHATQDPIRGTVEAFIRRIYAERFGADVEHFAPVLVSLRDEQGAVVSAAGYRAAKQGPLFLERYLHAPVESLLASHAGTPPVRAGIVEVGHLAAARAGEGQRLIRLLGPHLARLGCEWVVSTVTEELHQLFIRIGVTPLMLAAADPAALGPEARRWGRYYDHHPVVLAGHLQRALRDLSRRRARAGGPA